MGYGKVGADFATALAAELKWQLASDRIKGSTLARGFGVTQSSVSNWLNGVSPMPLSFGFSACTVMGAAFPDLLALAEQRPAVGGTILISGELQRSRPRADISPETYALGEAFADCVAAELKSQIRLRGFSLRKLGKVTSHSPSLIGIWLNGKRPLPVPFTYNACGELGLTFAELAQQAENRLAAFTDGAADEAPQRPQRALPSPEVPSNEPPGGQGDEIDQIAADRGVLRLAARGELSAEALREIAAVIERHIPKQDP